MTETAESARAGADMLLARSERPSQRFYSMSGKIQRERADYYNVLERPQQGTLDVPAWMQWFLGCLDRAIEGDQGTLGAVLDKARFWESVSDVSLNAHQRKMLNRPLDGFQGKLTTSKWAEICETSDDSALCDITEFLQLGILGRSTAGGRSTSYTLRRVSASVCQARAACRSVGPNLSRPPKARWPPTRKLRWKSTQCAQLSRLRVQTNQDWESFPD